MRYGNGLILSYGSEILLINKLLLIMSITEKIRGYIIETSLSKIDQVKDDTMIFDTGLLDSMGLLFLIEFINEEYNIEVSDEELNPKNFQSIESIVKFINSKN